MLAKRIIPVFLKRGTSLVKGKQFNSWRSVGHVLQAVKIYQARGVDELLLLDIDAKDGPDFEAIKSLSEECYMPLSVGGGVRSVMDVNRLLGEGADKIIIGSAISIVEDCATLFGSQAITVSIDTKNREVYTNNGQHSLGVDAVSMAQEMEQRGAGEILLQSIEKEGTMEGYDLGTIELVAQSVSIPVIASGGCGTPQHAVEAIQAGASAVGIGAMFQFSDYTPKDVAEHLFNNDIEVRF